MTSTLLIFRSASDIADFIIRREVKNAGVDAREYSLSASLTENDIYCAMTEYGATRYCRAARLAQVSQVCDTL